MAEQITLTPLVNLENQTTAVNAINANNAVITTAFTDVLSLTGVTPNAMQSQLDMNSNQIINLPAPATANSPLRLQDLDTFTGGGTVTNIPSGGITGQVLGKTSDVNYAVSWLDVENGVSLTDFGAIGDGNIANAAINATALTNALATGNTVFVPYTANGYHFGTNTIAVGVGQCIYGENPNVTFLSTVTTNNPFLHVYNYGNTTQFVTIKNLTINMNGAGTGTTAIRFNNNVGVILNVEIEDINFVNCYQAIGDDGSTNWLHNVKVRKTTYTSPAAGQIYLRNTNGEILFEDTVGGIVNNTIFARFDNVLGLDIVRFDVAGGSAGTYYSGQWGLQINGNSGFQASVWLERVIVDSTAGNGIQINNMNYVNGTWVEGFGNLGYQIQLVGCTDSILTAPFAYGATGVSGASASKSGILISGCTNVTISQGQIYVCTGDGLDIVNSSNSYIDAISNSNGGYGVNESGTSNANRITGCFSGNTTAAFALTGSTSSVWNYASGTSFNPEGSANPIIFGQTAGYPQISFSGAIGEAQTALWGGGSSDNGLYLSTVTGNGIHFWAGGSPTYTFLPTIIQPTDNVTALGGPSNRFTTLNLSSTATIGGALTYGGVTLSNAVTGTGSMVLSSSPSLVTPALGTPASGVVTNLTGTASININGTVGATTPSTGAFTTLSASSTVSGAGFSTYLASPPAIGGTAPAAGTFTTLATNVAPTTVSNTSELIGSAQTINKRMPVTLSGTVYWIPCSSTAF